MRWLLNAGFVAHQLLVFLQQQGKAAVRVFYADQRGFDQAALSQRLSFTIRIDACVVYMNSSYLGLAMKLSMPFTGLFYLGDIAHLHFRVSFQLTI